MNTAKKWIAFVLLGVGLILLNIIAALLPGKADLTEEKLYTLSKGSRDILEKLEEPLILNFYFSRSMEGLPIQFKNYATRVEDLLRQYDRVGGGGVRLNIIDPRPDSDEEQAAIRAGLRGVPTANGDNLYFGLQAVLAEQEAVIEFFNQEREPFLEFDISQLVVRVEQWEKPVLGVISGLPVFGQAPQGPPGMPQAGGMREWSVFSELRKTWEVRAIEEGPLPDDLDVLAVIHPPRDLSPSLRFEIDQFVLAGKPVLLAVDPSSYLLRAGMSQQQMMMGGPPPTASDLPELLSAYGIEYDSSRVVGDFANSRLVRPSAGAAPVQYPPLIDIREFASELPPTSTLEEITMVEPGSIALAEGALHDFVPILTTSAESGTIASSFLNFSSMDAVAGEVERDETAHTLAALVRGRFETAFPDGSPTREADSESEALAASPGMSTLLVVADSDFLADAFSVRVVNFLGTQAVQPINDNLTFAINLVDYIGGSEDLLMLRGKGQAARPFTLVEKLERRAQAEYQRELQALEERLSAVRNELNQLRSQQGEEQALVASPEVLEAIESYQLQEAELRSERREIRRKLREDIETLELRLALFNLLAAPLLITAFGLYFFSKRNRKRKHQN